MTPTRPAGLGHPPEGHRPTGGGQVEVEDDGKVQEDRPGGGDPEVVHHDGPRQVDLLGAHEVPLRVGDVIAEEGRPEDVVAEEDQLPGVGVHLGMGGHGRGQVAVEVVDPGPLEVGRDGVGEARLDEGQGGAGEADHVGVGRAVDRLDRAAGRRCVASSAASRRVRTQRFR